MYRKGHAWTIGLLYCLEHIIFNLILDLRIYVLLISCSHTKFNSAVFEVITAML